MSLFCTVSELLGLPLVCELTNDLEKYFRSNTLVEVVAQVIVVISFVGDICCMFREVGPGEMSGIAGMTFQGNSRSLQIDRSHTTSY